MRLMACVAGFCVTQITEGVGQASEMRALPVCRPRVSAIEQIGNDLFKWIQPESQGQNLTLTVVYVPYALDIGGVQRLQGWALDTLPVARWDDFWLGCGFISC